MAGGDQVPGDPVFPGSSDATTASQLYFARSEDGGATFPTIAFCAVGDNGVQFNDKQWFAVQRGPARRLAPEEPFRRLLLAAGRRDLGGKISGLPIDSLAQSIAHKSGDLHRRADLTLSFLDRLGDGLAAVVDEGLL